MNDIFHYDCFLSFKFFDRDFGDIELADFAFVSAVIVTKFRSFIYLGHGKDFIRVRLLFIFDFV